MGTDVVVEMKVLFDFLVGFQRRLILVEVHFLVLQGSPQSLGEDVVEGSSSSIHADFDVMTEKDIKVAQTREL